MAALKKERKESMAFMPSSNDALYANLDNNGSPLTTLCTSSSQHNHASSNELQSPSADDIMFSQHIPREKVSSASDLPHVQRQGDHGPSDSKVWYELYCSKVAQIDEERLLWAKERAAFVADKERLNATIANLTTGRNDSAFENTWNAAPNRDKVYYNAETVKMANQKLAEITNVGYSSVDTSRVTTPGGASHHSFDLATRNTHAKRRTSSSTGRGLESIFESKTESSKNRKHVPVVVPRVTVGGDSTTEGKFYCTS